MKILKTSFYSPQKNTTQKKIIKKEKKKEKNSTSFYSLAIKPTSNMKKENTSKNYIIYPFPLK
jgi:hypothetical protein